MRFLLLLIVIGRCDDARRNLVNIVSVVPFDLGKIVRNL